MSQFPSTETYDIGAICRLTGVNAPNLRMWEKRYSVVEPVRSENGRRLYSAADLERLKLLKALVDSGHSIGSIAPLTNEVLRERISSQFAADTFRRAEGEDPTWPKTIIVVGSRSAELCLTSPPAFPGAVLKERYKNPREALSDPTGVNCDLLLVEAPTLFEKDLAELLQLAEQTGARRTLLIYDFAQSSTLAPLSEDSSTVTALKGPPNIEQLRLAWRSHPLPSPTDDENEPVPAPPRFTSDQLAYLSTLSTTLECECPHHLASLISGLVAFESYSEQCENESEADARLHHRLGSATGRARAIMEDALQELLVVEKIVVE